MKKSLRITEQLLNAIHKDLSRRHPFALERVGFISCKHATLPDGMIFIAEKYLPVADEDYLESRSAGAMMGSDAIRKALQFAYNEPVSMFHVHRHEHIGKPRFSLLDIKESAKFVPDFWKVRPELDHGAIVLSRDSAYGLAWDRELGKPQELSEINVIGRPLWKFWE